MAAAASRRRRQGERVPNGSGACSLPANAPSNLSFCASSLSQEWRRKMETESRAQTTNQTQADSLSPSPNPVSPVPLSNPASGPRYGTVIPTHIFVGGIDFKTNENDLRKFFSQYGSVKEVKIVNDRAGVSKGYGFITFETQEDAQKIYKRLKNLIIRIRNSTLVQQ